MNMKLDNRGVSMIETLVVVLIFTIISGGLISVMTVGDKSWQVNRVKIELQQELRKSMDAMVNDLRQSGGASIVNVPTDGNWYSTITFRKPAGVSAGSIAWDNTTIQFLTSNGQLQRVYGANTKIVSQDISSMQFRRFSAAADTLEVALQAQKNTNKGVPIVYDLDFNIQIRN